MSEELRFIEYSELLNQLKQLKCNGGENHLLLGNGFNISLGIDTRYKIIFSKMLELEPTYGNIEEEIQGEGIKYDIEKLIGEVDKNLPSGNTNIDQFLGVYVSQKIKLDFMKAFSLLVREKVNKIYKDRNRGIHSLFENFHNYFTLNYDTFLYLLLMKFKKPNDIQSQAGLPPNFSSPQRSDISKTSDDIDGEIRRIRESGELSISVENDELTGIDLRDTTKSHFQINIQQYNKEADKGWTVKNIETVCDQIWEEEKNDLKLDKINDGFQGNLFEGNNSSQNIFFLHGSFHIYQDDKKGVTKKITQKGGKALCQRLEEVVQTDEERVICILTDSSKKKVEQIKKNQYLKKGFKHLSELSGSIVIFGSSLSDNDRHVFRAINKSLVRKIYISSCEDEKLEHLEKSKKFFTQKEIVLFDYNSIDYNVVSHSKNGELK